MSILMINELNLCDLTASLKPIWSQFEAILAAGLLIGYYKDLEFGKVECLATKANLFVMHVENTSLRS